MVLELGASGCAEWRANAGGGVGGERVPRRRPVTVDGPGLLRLLPLPTAPLDSDVGTSGETFGAPGSELPSSSSTLPDPCPSAVRPARLSSGGGPRITKYGS